MILIVDDKRENIVSLQAILESKGFACESADSGELALKKILKRNYHLIMLDVQMPGMDGFEVADMIMSYSGSRDTPIIFLTALSKEKKYITRGLKSGAVDYITKPVDPDLLLLKVSSIWAQSERRLASLHNQKRLEKEVQESNSDREALEVRNDELQAVLESLPQMAFTVNADSAMEYVNGQWRSVFGHNSINTFLSDREIHARWKQAIEDNRVFEEEVRVPEAGNQFFLLRVAPMDGGIKFVGTLTNIHQQKIAHELLEEEVGKRTAELRETNKELKKFNEELQQVSWVLSHDLKEPLRKIMTYVGLLQDGGITPEQTLFFKKIVASAERMTRLITDLLEYSQVTRQEEFESCDLQLVFDQVKKELDPEPGIKVSGSNLPVIEARPHYMFQLFQNLISNSVKFRREDVPLNITVSADLVQEPEFDAAPSENGDYCRLSFRDNGVGFKEQHLHLIFKVFQRLKQKNVEGTGIGLAIVKKIIDTHSGRITARSAPNVGAEFIIILPVKQETTI